MEIQDAGSVGMESRPAFMVCQPIGVTLPSGVIANERCVMDERKIVAAILANAIGVNACRNYSHQPRIIESSARILVDLYRACLEELSEREQHDQVQIIHEGNGELSIEGMPD